MADTGGSSERLSDLRARWEADRRSRVFLQLAEEYRRQGQPLEAMAVLDEGLTRHPSSVAGKVLQGRCRLESGQAEAAAATLEEVVSRDPTHIVAYRWLTEAYLELGDTDRARRRLEIYTQLNPQGEDLPELSRRLVALEDPARRLSVGPAAGNDQAPPPRPSAEVTEAPTTVTPVPPELRPSGESQSQPASEHPTVSLPIDEVPTPQASPPDSRVDPTEAPTTAIPIADTEVSESDSPPAAAWPWSREAEPAPSEEAAQPDAPGASEAMTAKVRLESLGLVPHSPEAEAGPETETRAGEGTGGEPPSEQPTGEIPWWRPRPVEAPGAFETQEAPELTAGSPKISEDDAQTAEPEDEPSLSSEAPTGIFDAAVLVGSADPPSEEGGAPEGPLDVVEPSPSEPRADEHPREPATDGVVFDDTRDGSTRPPLPAAASESEPFADLLAAPTEGGTAVEPPEAGLGTEPEVPVTAPTGDSRHEGGNGNGADVFRLDPGALFAAVDLSVVPTRPLSIPYWLTGPEGSGRSAPETGPGTETLAKLYLDQGHSDDAAAIYDKLAEPEAPSAPESEAAAADLSPASRVEITAAGLLGDYEPARGGLTAKQVYVLQRYLARLRGDREGLDVS